MSDEYWLVQIEGIYLTSDGTSGGLECRSTVSDLAKLRMGRVGNSRKALSGRVINRTHVNLGRGGEIIIRPFVTSWSVRNSLQTILDIADSADSTFTVVISNASESFNLECKPWHREAVGGPTPLEGGNVFDGDDVMDTVLNVLVDSVNSITP